ncbi:unnamed protein product [Coregonus sp. 'balchen']|nr:unnamed protein product [Coregonus sp. 'balchen']
METNSDKGIGAKESGDGEDRVTNKKPSHVSITKVKQFPGSSSFAKRSMWSIDQLKQVNGCDPNRILHHTCQRYSSQSKPEFVNCQSKLLGDDETVDSVVFRCKVFLNRMRKEVVLNSRRQGRRLLLEGNSILHSAADSVTSAVQKASQALNERGERLGRAEEKTGEMKNSAEQFSVTAHKLAMKHKC